MRSQHRSIIISTRMECPMQSPARLSRRIMRYSLSRLKGLLDRRYIFFCTSLISKYIFHKPLLYCTVLLRRRRPRLLRCPHRHTRQYASQSYPQCHERTRSHQINKDYHQYRRPLGTDAKFPLNGFANSFKVGRYCHG
jgi:hypothetical protein